MRGRASVAGVWCARGRRGVCGARGVEVGLGGLGADALRVRDWDLVGSVGGRLRTGVPVIAKTSSSCR